MAAILQLSAATSSLDTCLHPTLDMLSAESAEEPRGARGARSPGPEEPGARAPAVLLRHGGTEEQEEEEG